MCPRAVTMIARMRPCAMATPRRSPPPVITEPAPTKTRAKAPTNSAIDRRRVSPCTARRLGPTPDGMGRDGVRSARVRARPSSVRGPLRLVLDTHRVRDPVDVVEVGDDLQGVVDRGVAPAFRADGVE